MVGGAETPDRQGHTHAPRLRTGRAISAAAVPLGVRPIPTPGSSARGASAGKRSPHETCR